MMATGQRDRKPAKQRKGAGGTVPTLRAVQMESNGVHRGVGGTLRKTHCLGGLAVYAEIKLRARDSI